MFDRYKSVKTFRYSFILTAILIAIASLWVTQLLVDELKEEERKKMEIWAESVALMSSQALLEDLNNANAFDNYTAHLLKIIQNNTTIPTIHVNERGSLLYSSNIRFPAKSDSLFITKKIKALGKKHHPIIIQLDEQTVQYVYYDDSIVLKQLQGFPVVQLTVVFAFILISFLALNSMQKSEQNRVWAGLSKETAHQLGTPISSLMAWVEILKDKEIDPELPAEMDKDVQRLKIIAERFSKIGSAGDLEPIELASAVNHTVSYMRRRISSKVAISVQLPQRPVIVPINESLFGWTIENLIKNAVDAMNGQGQIKITAFAKETKLFLDISDTGRGIPKSLYEAVFRPGYTTRPRGWGLGLSLVKRIIESYHKGRVYVQKSEIGKGTTIRIELRCLPPD